jgi:hypothetical protein
MIDPKELEQVLKDMEPRQVIYELVKAEMQRRGRWKVAKRGKGFQKGYDPNRKKLKPE